MFGTCRREGDDELRVGFVLVLGNEELEEVEEFFIEEVWLGGLDEVGWELVVKWSFWREVWNVEGVG